MDAFQSESSGNGTDADAGEYLEQSDEADPVPSEEAMKAAMGGDKAEAEEE